MSTAEEQPGAPDTGSTGGIPARLTRDDRARERILADIDARGLGENLRQLLSDGFTVIPGVLSPRTVARAREAILKRVESLGGRRVDPDTASAADFHGMAYQHYLIFDDPVFQEILLEPKPLALITYLLGESCLLSSMGSHFRGPGGFPPPLHADAAAPGMCDVASVANCNYALTPYSRSKGALVLVPGSHRRHRHPTRFENWTAAGQPISDVMSAAAPPENLDDLPWEPPAGTATMEINPGDAVIFHGNTWHGGWRRDEPGVRMNLAAYFCRPHIATQERRGDDRHSAVFDRLADQPRFARLLGQQRFCGWREEGPDYAVLAGAPTGLYD